MSCTTCKRTITQIKALYGTRDEWLWTSPFSRKVVCSDCLIAEYEQHERDIPNNSLSAINEARRKRPAS